MMSYDVYTGLLKMFPFPAILDTDTCFMEDNNHPQFDELRNKYKIESVAGNTDDLSKAINLLNWVSEHSFHKGNYEGIIADNSLDLLDYAYDKGPDYGINCVSLAKILTESLLAVGLKARQVFIMPCSPYDDDNHVITQVYIKQISQWVMLDPTLNAYFTNGDGEYLGLLDLRNHLANQETVFLNKDAKYNGGYLTDGNASENIEYFAKNLFYFQISETSTFGTPDDPLNRYRLLSPVDFDIRTRQLSNIEYRVKKYGDSAWVQKWLQDIKNETYYYCSAADFAAAPADN